MNENDGSTIAGLLMFLLKWSTPSTPFGLWENLCFQLRNPLKNVNYLTNEKIQHRMKRYFRLAGKLILSALPGYLHSFCQAKLMASSPVFNTRVPAFSSALLKFKNVESLIVRSNAGTRRLFVTHKHLFDLKGLPKINVNSGKMG